MTSQNGFTKKEETMKKILSRMVFPALIAALVTLFSPPEARGVGTSAGTDISNQASVDYTESGNPYVATSNTAIVTVDEVLSMTLTWQDGANVTVASPDTDGVLTYLLTNTGNGTDTYSFTTDNALGGDDFDPTNTRVYFDTDLDGSFSGGDTLYVFGVNDPILAADGTLTIFLVNDIPAALLTGNTGDVGLTGTSTTGSGAVGTKFAGLGDFGTDAILAASGGTVTTTATYAVSGVILTLLKTQTISDLLGGTDPLPGATISYTVTITTTGTGTATGVVFSDPIPTNTTYVNNTLTLDDGGGAVALTDGADLDAGDVGVTTAGTVTVAISDLTNASPVQTITFDVTID